METEKTGTGKKKLSDFWYYYKIPFIIAVLLIALIAVMLSQCAGRENPDYQVVLYMKKSIPEEITDVMANELSKFGDDLNDDGKVLVEIVNCSYEEGGSTNLKMAQTAKLQAQLSLPDSLLFICDQYCYSYLDNLNAFETTDILPDYDGRALRLNGTPMNTAVGTVSRNFISSDYFISKRRLSSDDGSADALADDWNGKNIALLEKLAGAYTSDLQ